MAACHVSPIARCSREGVVGGRERGRGEGGVVGGRGFYCCHGDLWDSDDSA